MPPEARHIGDILRERNIQLATNDPVARGGFTQVPNFILKHGELSLRAKSPTPCFFITPGTMTVAFPGQERLANDMGMSQSRVSEFIKELQGADLIQIMGKCCAPSITR